MHFKYFLWLAFLGSFLNPMFGQEHKKNKTKDSNDSILQDGVSQDVNFSIGITYNRAKTFFYDAPIILDNCTSCRRENYRGNSVYGIGLDVRAKIKNRHHLKLGLGVSQYGYRNDHYFENRLFNQSEEFDFLASTFGHSYTLKKSEGSNFSITNSFAVDTYLPGHLFLINRFNFSYLLELSYSKKVNNDFSIAIQPFFKRSLLKYNRVLFDKDYFPYSYGLGVGVRFDKSNNKYNSSKAVKENDLANENSKTIFFELLGPGGLYSINYERRIAFSSDSTNGGISMSAGISGYPINDEFEPSFRISIPIQLTYSLQYAKNRYDVGVASSIYNSSNPSVEGVHFLIARYIRSFKRKNKRREWGIFISPVIIDRRRIDFFLWGGLRYGYKL